MSSPLGAGRVLIATSAPRTAQLLDNLGFIPVVADISEFEKLEGLRHLPERAAAQTVTPGP